MHLLALAALAGAAQSAACDARTLDYASWREAPGQQWDYRWSGERGALSLLGVDHRRDPAHPQFARIAAAFAEAAPDLVYFEGPDRGIGGDAEETIRTRGESGYVRFLAGQAGAEARSLEPSPGEQLGMLLAEHPVDRVLLFFVLRETARLRDREELSGEALDAAVATLLGRSAAMAAQGGLTLPFAHLAGLETAAARYWPGRDWRALPAAWFSPGADDAATGGVFLGAVNRSDSINRDRYMARQLAAAALAGRRVFAAVGRNHVPMQAPALDCALGRAG